MAASPQFSFRVPEEDAELFETLRDAQDRERSDMARRVFHAGLLALDDEWQRPGRTGRPRKETAD
jgi:hypothetical protein